MEPVPVDKFDQEELEILQAFQEGKLERAVDADELMQRHQEYAAAMFRKDERINVRLTSRNLRRLKKRALAEGIPYQVLASSVLHKYVEGLLQESN